MRAFILFLVLFINPVWADVPVQLTGHFIQGGMILGQAPVGSAIDLDGQSIQQADNGAFAFGFGRDAPLQHQLTVVWQGQTWQKTLQLKAHQYNIQRVQGVSEQLISPHKTEQQWQRIKDEAQLVTQARQKTYLLDAFTKPFQWPVLGPITGVYGSQRVYNGQPGRPHYGVDIAAPMGARVSAPNAGVVTVAKSMYYSGGTVIVDHGYGISSTFLHLSKISVKVGDKVAQGDKIGEVGQSGIATGPHLDWRINWYLTRLDAQLVVDDMQHVLKQKEQNK